MITCQCVQPVWRDLTTEWAADIEKEANSSAQYKRGTIFYMNTVQKIFSIVGQSVPRVYVAAKVTGNAKYVADLVIPGMIEGKFLRSPYAHARIRSIDTTE